MNVARSVAEVLSEHVTLEVECIDRLYLNLYVPILQEPAGIGHFWIRHRGHRFATSSLMAPMTRAFVTSIERFAEREGIPLITFKKGQRKEDIAKEYLATFSRDEGVLFIGKAQEKASVTRTEKRRNPTTAPARPRRAHPEEPPLPRHRLRLSRGPAPHTQLPPRAPPRLRRSSPRRPTHAFATPQCRPARRPCHRLSLEVR